MSAFANEMALDYYLAKTKGLCMTLNLTGKTCVTLMPDNSDNITVLEPHWFIWWLNDKFGPYGAIILHVLFHFWLF